MRPIPHALAATGAIIALSGCQSTGEPDNVQYVQIVNDEGEALECRTIRNTGSLIGERTCATAAQWQQIDEDAEEAGEEFRNRYRDRAGRNAPTGGLGN